MQNERVRHIMTESVLSIDVNESITEAMHLFGGYPVHHLPVVDGGVLLGILSTADMLKLEYFLPKSGSQASAELLNRRFKIRNLMRSPVISAGLDDSISDAASRMITHAVHALPVIQEDARLLGMVTTTDIMQALLHGIGIERTAEQHEGTSKPAALVMRRALEAANLAAIHGTDSDGIAASLLYLNQRNVLLEELRVDVARYMHGGQDESLHSHLIKDLQSLEPRSEQPELSIPL